MEKKAIIIGAGPAGLTAAYELLTRTDIKPIILEKSGDIGGISKTVNYKGNRIDIGGHRFFSKSDRVMNWWLKMMPIQAEQETPFHLTYHNQTHAVQPSTPGPNKNSEVDPNNRMLVRKRLSRIYFLRKFFTYPIQLSLDTLAKLGLWTTIAIIFSYLRSQLFPRKQERNLEDFMINRFGRVLYKLFFKDYTEKVWGIPCNKISAEWGAQRIKGVSISKAILHALQSATKKSNNTDIRQKSTETSLIEQFLYPMYGPGQMWVEVARQVESMGGKILMQHDVKQIYSADSNRHITAVAATNKISGETCYLEGDYFFSTMPVQELIAGLDGPIPDDVKEVAAGLQYRDFITVGILLNKLSFLEKKTGEWKPLELKDTWIYIQDTDVKVGRLQIFNNWSPYMVKDPNTSWVGMEFFCNKTDDFWNRPDDYIKDFAIQELEKIGLASHAHVLDATVLRMEKTYPAYFGTYERFDVVRDYLDRFENLFLVGRNGMHKYNNSDHSMLTAMLSVDNIVAGISNKANIWAVNTEMEYHEETERPSTKPAPSKAATLENELTLKMFILSNYKNTLTFISFLLISEFLIFKFYYPYPNFMPDSYSYLEAAMRNSDINMWPIGYSKFLRLLSAFTHSDTILVLVQFLGLAGSILYFTFTLLHLFRPGKIVSVILLAIPAINPVILNLSNYISADAIFYSISLIWISQLLKILYTPNRKHLVIHGVLILLAFSFRYNSLYYPIISVVVILMSQLHWRKKAFGITFFTLLLAIFIWHNGNNYRALTGDRQFSAFGGWQLASNALFMYAHIQHDTSDVPKKLRPLHRISQIHMDSLRKLSIRPDSTLGIYYLWNDKAPLKTYLTEKFKTDTTTPYFKKWASLAPLYSEYGLYLIKKHPVKFAKYYILPNAANFYVPPVEFLGMYNMKEDSVKSIAKMWFGYKTNHIRAFTKETALFNIYSILNAMTNSLFICVMIAFAVLRDQVKNAKNTFPIVFVTVMFWLLNMIFSILASPVVLRYQLCIMLIIFSVSIIVIEQIAKKGNELDINRKLYEVHS